MAKVHMLQQAPETLYGHRGLFVLADTKHGVVALKWPRKRGRGKQGYDFYRQTEFGLVASMVASPNTYDYSTAVEMAKNTEQVPRDILMMCAMGTYYTFAFKDGTEWKGYRLLQPNVQQILDQLGAGPGALIWRAPIGWVSLEISEPGMILTSDGFGPVWAEPEGGGGDAAPARMTYFPSITGDGQTARTMGARLKPYIPMEVTVVGAILGNHAGQTVKFSIWSMAGNDLDVNLGETADIVVPAGQNQFVEGALDGPVTMDPATNFAILCQQIAGASIPSDMVVRSNERPLGNMFVAQQGNLRTSTYPPAPGVTMTLDNDYRVMILKGNW